MAWLGASLRLVPSGLTDELNAPFIPANHFLGHGDDFPLFTAEEVALGHFLIPRSTDVQRHFRCTAARPESMQSLGMPPKVNKTPGGYVCGIRIHSTGESRSE